MDQVGGQNMSSEASCKQGIERDGTPCHESSVVERFLCTMYVHGCVDVNTKEFRVLMEHIRVLITYETR
jgi:hypothetical protein